MTMFPAMGSVRQHLAPLRSLTSLRLSDLTLERLSPELQQEASRNLGKVALVLAFGFARSRRSRGASS
jgi:hypothetical protein